MNSKKKVIIICICSFVILISILLCFKMNIQTNINNTVENKEHQQNEQKEQVNTQQNPSFNTLDIDKIEETPKNLKIYDIEEGYLTVPYNSKALKHNYNWDNLSTSDNGYYFYSDNLYETKFGIDVSEYQGNINWEKVKKAGVDFAIIRLGYRGYGSSGKLMLDHKFIKNVEQATKNEIAIGIYFFSQAINEEEAIAEATYVLDNIRNKNITYPICFDLEKIKFDTARTDNLTIDEITKISLAFCQQIKNAGYTPMIYGNAKTFTTRMHLEQFNNYQKWYADYQDKPLYPYDFAFWQYSEKGSINGINTKVDLNLHFVPKNLEV